MTDIEIIKRYKKRTSIIVGASLGILLILPSIVLFATWSKAAIWAIVIMGVISIIALGINFVKTNNEIEMILKNELDPQKYYRVVHGANLATKYRTEDIQTAYFLGDYASAIGIINEQLPKTKAKGIIAEYKTILSYCYFETGQLDKLLLLITDLRAYAEEFKKENFFKSLYLALADYYENFINGNFVKCCDLANLLTDDNKKFISNSFRMKITLYKALALFCDNRKNEAKPFFEECYYGCPKLNYSVLSKKYLDLIADGKDVEYAELVPPVNDYISIPPVNKPQKWTFKQRIALCLCGVLLVGGVYGGFIDDDIAPIGGYKTPLDAICEYVDAEEIIAEIAVDENNSLYVYSIGYEYIGVAAVENNNGRYVYNVDSVYTIEQWVSFDEYGFGLANIDKEICYNITDDKDDISPNAVNSEFEYDGETYYIYIISIEDNNTWFYSAW